MTRLSVDRITISVPDLTRAEATLLAELIAAGLSAPRHLTGAPRHRDAIAITLPGGAVADPRALADRAAAAIRDEIERSG